MVGVDEVVMEGEQKPSWCHRGGSSFISARPHGSPLPLPLDLLVIP